MGLSAAAAGCSRHVEAPRVFGAKETYDYLKKVGSVRVLINIDNKERIPAMIRGQDVTKLMGQGAKTEEYKHTLSSLPPNGVDPEALKFTQNFVAILDSYRSVCSDSAELFREIRESNARQGGPLTVLPPIIHGSDSYQTDTIGTVDSLLDSMNPMDMTAKAGAVFLQPIVDRLRDDREKLRSAKVAHHDFTERLKVQFKDRYPGLDWTSREILP